MSWNPRSVRTEVLKNAARSRSHVTPEFVPDGVETRHKKSVVMDRPTDLLNFVRRSLVLDTMTSVLPKTVRRTGSRLLSIQVPDRVDWPSGLKKDIHQELAREARSILEYAEKPRDWWAR